MKPYRIFTAGMPQKYVLTYAEHKLCYRLKVMFGWSLEAIVENRKLNLDLVLLESYLSPKLFEKRRKQVIRNRAVVYYRVDKRYTKSQVARKVRGQSTTIGKLIDELGIPPSRKRETTTQEACLWLSVLLKYPSLQMNTYAKYLGISVKTLQTGLIKKLGVNLKLFQKIRRQRYEDQIVEYFRKTQSIFAVKTKFKRPRAFVVHLLIEKDMILPDWGFAYRPDRARDIDTLYLVRLYFSNGTVLFKLGRTFKTLGERFGRDPLVKSWDVISLWHTYHCDVWPLEKALGRVLKPYKQRGPETFEGRTECFPVGWKMEKRLLRAANLGVMLVTSKRRQLFAENPDDFSKASKQDLILALHQQRWTEKPEVSDVFLDIVDEKTNVPDGCVWGPWLGPSSHQM